MKIYTLDIINDLKNEKNFELDLNVVNFLNTTLNDIKKQSSKKNEYCSFVDKNKSKFNKYKNNEKKIFDNKNITNNYSNKTLNNNEKQNDIITKNRINRIKVLNNTNSIDAINNNIRKILNKLSSSNYEKLKNEFLCYYNTIINENEINSINEFIFSTLTQNNQIFSELYSSLFLNLINKNSDFSILLNNNIYKFINFINNVNYDTMNNKNNDELKCFLLFYINCIKKNVISYYVIFDLLNNVYNELFNYFEIENKKIYCEIINEFIFFIINNSYDIIKNKDEYIIIYKNIEKIKVMKNNTCVSISNKIIFKNMDLYDKFPYIN